MLSPRTVLPVAPGPSPLDTFAASLARTARSSWYLIALRVRAPQRQQAILRLIRPDGSVRALWARRPARWAAGISFGVAFVEGPIVRAELQIPGLHETPDTVSLWLLPIATGLAALAACLQRPLAFTTAFIAAVGPQRQRVLAGLAACSPDMRAGCAGYAEWLADFDTWSARRLAPFLAALPGRPGVQALVFAARTGPALDATLASLRRQAYPVASIAVIRPGQPLPGSAAPFTAVLQAGEVLAPHALPLLLHALAYGDIAYADEDRVAQDGNRSDPSFKPGPGLMMMCSGLLSRGAWLCRTALLPERAPNWAECLRLETWFALDPAHQVGRVRRVPVLLTQRRADAEAAPADELASLVDAALRRRGVKASARPGFPLRLAWEQDCEDMVDIIVPSRLRGSRQTTCIRDVLDRTAYPNAAMVVVVTQDGALDATQREAARAIEASGRARISLLRRPDFNYPAANNHAAAETQGTLICLLNDDVSVIEGGWLGRMAAMFSDPMTGIVGAKLYYPDDRTQHGGVIMGLAGLAEHAHKFLPRGEPGYMSRAVLDQEMSAVTGACLMVRRSLYELLGGLDERLPTGFNDIDFCLRVRALGYSVVMAAGVELVHHETISFGHHYWGDAATELAVAQEMWRRWPEVIAADPFHNPNLSLLPNAEWTLARPPRALDHSARAPKASERTLGGWDEDHHRYRLHA